MIRALYIVATIPAVAAALIATPWRPNPKTKRGERLLFFAVVYIVVYLIVFHYWLKVF